jgi:hypothetical protein
MGDRNALVLNYVVQGIGVAGPLLWPGAVGVLACALMVGCTFLGSVLLTQRLARALHPHQGPRISAALITLYGLAQLTGPWLARLWLERGGSMGDTYWLGAGALLWATLWTLRTRQAPAHPATTPGAAPQATAHHGAEAARSEQPASLDGARGAGGASRASRPQQEQQQ